MLYYYLIVWGTYVTLMICLLHISVRVFHDISTTVYRTSFTHTHDMERLTIKMKNALYSPECQYLY